MVLDMVVFKYGGLKYSGLGYGGFTSSGIF